MSTDVQSSDSFRAGRYPKTHWALVYSAGAGETRALEELFRRYWFPVYGAFFDKLKDHHEAEDLTQRLFSEIFRRGDIARLRQENGHFRSFLKASIGNLFSNYVAERKTLKRGGTETVLSIDSDKAGEWLEQEPAEADDPGTMFDRRWIFAVVENAKNHLRCEHLAEGRLDQFETYQEFLLPQERAKSYAEVASELNQKEGTVRVNAYRIRQQFREQIRSTILDTVGSYVEADAELEYLSCLSGIDFASRNSP